MEWFQGKKGRLVKATGIVLIILLSARIALPYVVLRFANESLRELHGYRGNIDDISIGLIRGAYKIKKMTLNKRDTVTSEESEFFRVQTVDLSLQWSALLKGKIAGELKLENPTVYFVKEITEPKQVAGDSSDFRKLLKDFMPLDVNRFEIINGEVHYIDRGLTPPVDIYMSDIEVVAENLTNAESRSVLPATVTASARIYGGAFDLRLTLDPLAEHPTYDLNAELSNTDLTYFNPMFKAYGKFDVNRGSFGLYTESAGKDGKFVGYVKPVIRDLDILGPEDKDENLRKQFWEGLLGGVGVIFRNQPKDQIATKVPIEGDFGKTRVNIWYAIVDVLYNAFIQALRPAIDEQINIKNVNGENFPQNEFKKKLTGNDEKQQQTVEKKPEEEKQGLKEKIKSAREKRKERREERKKEKQKVEASK